MSTEVPESAATAEETAAGLSRRTFIAATAVVGGTATAGVLAAVPAGAAEASPAGRVSLSVNGDRYTVTVDNRTSLLDLLRERLDLTGSKKGCNAGACGACTVLVEGRRVVRQPGAGCAAIGGFNRTHAILGTSDHCVATHPSDLAVALRALDTSVHLLGPAGPRTIPLADFLLQPGTTPDREQALRPGELITAVELPAHPRPSKSGYLKVRDRQSYEFALTSAAVLLHVRGGVIRAAKVAAGGVGSVPWRLSAVERHLVGRRPSSRLWSDAAELAADGARPLTHNGFKVPLLQRTVERQLRIVGGSA